MSIEFWALLDDDAAEHALHVQNLRNQGWERVFSTVYYGAIEPVFSGKLPDDDESVMSTDVYSETAIFLSYMERDTTPKLNGLHTASVVEMLEKRVKSLEDRTDVLEQTADTDDEQPADRVKVFDIHGTLIDLINPHTSQFIPLGSIYDEVIYGALNEDEREGNHG